MTRVSIADQERENTHYLTVTLVLQGFACVAGLVLQIWCFRWFNFLGALLGLLFLLVAWRGIATSHGPTLKVFVAFQLAAALLVMLGMAYTFHAIQHYHPNEGYCSPKGLYYIAAVFAPLTFVFMLFGAIYARRAYNLSSIVAYLTVGDGNAEDDDDDRGRQRR